MTWQSSSPFPWATNVFDSTYFDTMLVPEVWQGYVDSARGAAASVCFHDLEWMKQALAQMGRFARALHALGHHLQAQRLAQLGHWELDLGTYAMHWSHEVYRIFERDPARFTPSCDSILALIHPDDRERVDREFKAAMVSHTPCEIAYRLQGPEGCVKFICQRCEALFDPQGKAVRLIGTMQDVSHSKQTERALQRLNRDLRLLSDCNTALVHAQDEATLLRDICRLGVDSGGYTLAWVGFAEHDDARSVRPV